MKDRLAEGGTRFGLLFLLVVVCIVFTVMPSTSATFATSANLAAVVGSQSPVAIIALAAMIPLVAGQFDISVGTTTSICAIASAALISHDHAALFEAALLAVVLGAAIGAVNGFFVSYLRVSSVIATLGMTTLLQGVISQATSGASINGIPSSMIAFADGSTLGLPNLLYVLAAVTLVTIYLLHFTPFGRYLYALGSNPAASKLVGLSVKRLTALSFIVAGAGAGLAAILLVTRIGGASPDNGFDYTLPALAAVFLGASTIRPGRFNAIGTIVAIAFLAALSSGLTLSGLPDYVQSYVNGGALVVGVALSAFLGRRSATRTHHEADA
jgi:ribose transport system permease protein